MARDDWGRSSMPLFDRPDIETLPDPPHNGTATSRAAAGRIRPAQREQHARIVAALRTWPDGLTDQQIQDATGLDPSAERPRRGELVAAGTVTDSGRTAATRSGRMATVWALAGRDDGPPR